MRFSLLPIILLLICYTTLADEMPQAGDVELSLSGGVTRVSGIRSSFASATSAWLFDGGHQWGGGLEWGRSSTVFDTSEHRGASVFYRYNWMADERRFFPYVGLAYVWARTETSSYEPGTDLTWRTNDVNDAWQPHIGIKWMLNRYVAFDTRLTGHFERHKTAFGQDSFLLFTGLSLFL